MTGIEIAALAGTAAGVLGQGANMVATGKLNKKNRDWQEKQTEAANRWTENMWAQEKAYNEEVWHKQRAYNEGVWHMENSYNSPAAQMQRFRDAGLNPNLMYGSTNMGGSIQQSPLEPASSGQGKKADFNPQPLPQLDLAGGIMAYYDLKARKAQSDNFEMQTELLRKERAIKDAQVIGLNIKNLREMFKYDFDSEMRNVSADYKREMVANLRSQMDNRLYQYDLNSKRVGFEGDRVRQYVKESNQKISESVARTGATYAGIGLINQKVMSEVQNRNLTSLKGLSEEQKIGIQELQKRMMDQTMDVKEKEMYLKFIQTILGAGRR